MGNTIVACSWLTEYWGSPPHTWGILDTKFADAAGDRITPTYMGNTEMQRNFWQHHQDHPHIHGEYLARLSSLAQPLGSPPHTWGIRDHDHDQNWIERITPTYMGNTFHQAARFCSTWDHPHIHGEYTLAVVPVVTLPGSPPHTWGILLINSVSVKKL